MSEKKTAKRRLPAIVRWILWVLLVQFVLINVSTAIYAYRFTHFYNDPSLLDKPAGNIFSKTWRLFTGPKQARSVVRERPVFSYDTVRLQTKSGLVIEGWYSKTDSTPKGTVILFHGATVNKGTILEEAYEFRYWGYNIMMIDFRGHGNSGGNATTIGMRESEEVKLAMDYVISRGDNRVFLYGLSMGAVAITKAVSDYDLKPTGIMLEMPFLSLKTYFQARARQYGFSRAQYPFGFLTTFWTGIENGFNAFKHKTTRYAKNVHCPVLMQSGTNDEFILAGERQEIFDAIASPQKTLVIYEGAQHQSLLGFDKVKWRKQIEEFLGTQSTQGSAVNAKP